MSNGPDHADPDSIAFERARRAETDPILEHCDACDAEPGEPCRPGCLGYALEHGEL